MELEGGEAYVLVFANEGWTWKLNVKFRIGVSARFGSSG